MTLMCLKVSMLLDWLHIFVPHKKRNNFYWASQLVMWINIIWYCAGIIRLNLSCTPHSKIWDFTIPGGHCFDNTKWWTATASVNLVSDVVILLLPQTTIWNLQLSRAKKIGVSLVFAMGILYVNFMSSALFVTDRADTVLPSVCAAASWRLAATLTYVAAEDATYTICPLVLSICFEILCIFTVLCVPSIPLIISRSPWLSRVTARFRTWRSASSSGWKSSGTPGMSAGFPTSTMRSDTSTYRNLDDQMSVPLQHMPASTESTSGSTKKLFENESGRGGRILRTTQVMAYETYVPHMSDEDKQQPLGR
jgi:hypothetical protein